MDTYIAFMDRDPDRVIRRGGNTRLKIGLLGTLIAMTACVLGPNLPLQASVMAGHDAASAQVIPS